MNENKKNEYQKITVYTKIYSLAVIYGAAYVFIDRAYIRLDGDPQKKVDIYFKAKEGVPPEKLKGIIGEFENELLNYSLREQIIKSNQKVREGLIAQALISPLYGMSEFGESEEECMEDPLGIAQTWEERFGKKKAKK